MREAFVAGARPLLLAGVAVLLAMIWLVGGRDSRLHIPIAVTAMVALGCAIGELVAAYVLIIAVIAGFVLVPVALIVYLVRRRAGRALGNGALLAAGWASVLGVMPFLAVVIATQGEPLCLG